MSEPIKVDRLGPLRYHFVMGDVPAREMVMCSIDLFREREHILPTDVTLNSIHEKQYKAAIGTPRPFEHLYASLPSDGVVAPASISRGLDVRVHFDASIALDTVLCCVQLPDEVTG